MLVVWALGQLTLPSAPTFRQCLDILQMYEEVGGALECVGLAGVEDITGRLVASKVV
jgi:hypothetical protein